LISRGKLKKQVSKNYYLSIYVFTDILISNSQKSTVAWELLYSTTQKTEECEVDISAIIFEYAVV